MEENLPLDKFNVAEGTSVRQLKISYTKGGGTWTLAKITITDDAIRAETPTNLRTETVDAETRRVRVRWDLADGLSDSKWRTFTTATVGGLAESKTLWRESFDSVPAANAATKIEAAKLADFNISGDWEAENLRQPTTAGALLIGWESSLTGSLMTPPLGQAFAAGHVLVLNAASRDSGTESKPGILPVSVVAGVETSRVAEVAITKTPREIQIPLPELAATDRILVQSITNYASRATFIHDLAICAAGDYQPRSVVTNSCGDATSVTDSAADMTVPTGDTNLWIEACATYDGGDSNWTAPFLVTLSDSSDDSDSDDDHSGETGDDATLAAPGDLRAGLLPDGRIRLGWTTPGGATNVTLRVWTLATEGGLAETKDDDILWRETFASAPATNNTSNIVIENADKFTRYTDKGADGWDIAHCVKVSLATNACAVKIGNSSSSGALVSQTLDLSAENLTLVVTAKHYGSNPNVILQTATLTADGSSTDGSSEAVVTNVLGQTKLGADFAEYAFPIKELKTGTAALLIESVRGTTDDHRIILDDIALVRKYTPVHTVTNEMACLNLGAENDEYELDAEEGVVRYAALCAQDATGVTSAWTETLALDPSALDEWQDRHLTFDAQGNLSATLDLEALYNGKKDKLIATDSPFRFLTNGVERLEFGNRNIASKTINAGVYVYTNVFDRNWFVLVPGIPNSVSVTNTAEMRVAIETGEFAVRKVTISGTFAQLGALNTVTRTLQFQWRCLVTDAATKAVTATDWQAFDGTGAFATAYSATDAAADADIAAKLAQTVTNVTAEATLRVADGTRPKAGDRIEVRVLNLRGKDEKEAPLGFRDFGVSAESAPKAAVFVIR